jgi:small subunit ribosomal protein S20
MPNLASSKKDLRRTERRTAFNDRLKTRVKKAVKNFNTLLAQNNTEKAVAALQQATKVLGKAAQKNVFKKKTSSRTISRLTKKLNKTTANNVKTAQQGS